MTFPGKKGDKSDEYRYTLFYQTDLYSYSSAGSLTTLHNIIRACVQCAISTEFDTLYVLLQFRHK